MKQGDSVSIPALKAMSIAAHLRALAEGSSAGTLVPLYRQWADALDPKPKVTDLSAVDYLTRQYEGWDRYEYTLKDGLAEFSVQAIATWLRAANTNSLAAALILGEQT
jgi:hypothetical protein